MFLKKDTSLVVKAVFHMARCLRLNANPMPLLARAAALPHWGRPPNPSSTDILRHRLRALP